MRLADALVFVNVGYYSVLTSATVCRVLFLVACVYISRNRTCGTEIEAEALNRPA